MRIFNARKEPHFIKAYERHFAPFRDLPIRFLEIGVQNGGSMKMWESYFPLADIVGIDNDPQCKQYEQGMVSIRIGDQSDKDFVKSLGSFDIVVDDGGHKMSQHFASFDVLFNQMKDGGIYAIEDLHTCYMDQYIDSKKTTEYIKDWIDGLQTKKLEYGIKSIHVYEGLVLIEKK